MRFDLGDLRLFLSVVEAGSITHGAERMHLAIAANAPPSPLHASPAVVGRLAQQAGAKRLILGHIGQFDLDAAIADVKKAYTGALTVGSDLQCTPVQ